MSAATENVEHPTRTQNNSRRYLFTAKHHGGDKKAAMWLPTISRDTEFSIFDLADLRETFDDRGWLYGVLHDVEGDLQDIGTWDEQLAEFQPGTTASEPWHGYPKWSVNEIGPANRRQQSCRPDKEVFNKMLVAGMINKIQRKRLLIGRHA